MRLRRRIERFISRPNFGQAFGLIREHVLRPGLAVNLCFKSFFVRGNGGGIGNEAGHIDASDLAKKRRQCGANFIGRQPASSSTSSRKGLPAGQPRRARGVGGGRPCRMSVRPDKAGLAGQIEQNQLKTGVRQTYP